MQTARRAGFSLIEALVVLAIGGMALAVIFSIGIKAGDTGFSLGRRAMSVADADVAISDLRAIIRSLSARPTATIIEGVDRPILAASDRLEADAVMERATGCAPQGWAGRLTLTIEIQGEARVLMCQAGPRKTPIMSLPRGAAAAFSYSTDRMIWTPVFESPNAPSNDAKSFRSHSLWVRLNAGPTLDVVDLAASGRPERWSRPDAPL
ncbi:type II secretion system protein [uncultured Brevundimonas sp.]|uniref:type II secretion system protein n=1 Tax=uncultured Brevundimonas sp. TaxID=213418 RepID=UPI000FA0930A|nr:prepilin-type N-terminal cleavage/methylation domain-containing protein [uncultured Brevundimonas sp.]